MAAELTDATVSSWPTPEVVNCPLSHLRTTSQSPAPTRTTAIQPTTAPYNNLSSK